VVDEPGLVVVNAAAFKADWQSRFDPAATGPAPFHPLEGGAVEVPTMRQHNRFLYAGDDGLELLELPYRHKEFSMLLCLPRERDGAIGELTWERVEALARELRVREVDVRVPRFSIRKPLDLKPVLTAMGLEAAFDRDRADFDAMIHRNIDAFRIYLADMLHQGWIEVDEKGSDAAATTTVSHYSIGCSAPPPPTPATFHADRPFVFLIVHNPSRGIMFAGWYGGPEAD
jgi:serpin B